MQVRQEKIKFLIYKRQLFSRNQVYSMDPTRPNIKYFYEHPKCHVFRGKLNLQLDANRENKFF